MQKLSDNSACISALQSMLSESTASQQQDRKQIQGLSVEIVDLRKCIQENKNWTGRQQHLLQTSAKHSKEALVAAEKAKQVAAQAKQEAEKASENASMALDLLETEKTKV